MVPVCDLKDCHFKRYLREWFFLAPQSENKDKNEEKIFRNDESWFGMKGVKKLRRGVEEKRSLVEEGGVVAFIVVLS